jgi:hypothetical protein
LRRMQRMKSLACALIFCEICRSHAMMLRHVSWKLGSEKGGLPWSSSYTMIPSAQMSTISS